MDTVYVNAMNSTTILTPHHVSSNSLQGALKSASDIVKRTSSAVSKSPGLVSTEKKDDLLSISLDQDMQRQLDEYNRSITIVVWYKADTEPIRLQHMNATFPYFQLLQLSALVADLGLAPGSYIDSYDPSTGKWEQHTMTTVRLVAKQQRLLYKTRRNLLEGLEVHHCLGLQEEVQAQPNLPLRHETQANNGSALKRPSPEESSTGQPHKIHVPNNYYAPRTAHAPAAPESLPQPSSDSPVSHSLDATTAPSSSISSPYSYQQSPIFYQQPHGPTSPVSSSTEAALPSQLTNTDTNTPSIPYHPHPPLKRWPNDYTVSELTSGFNTMEVLIRQPPDGATITQRTAFERVFGSRYVKSTVCRHRGLWRKAKGPLREQFEAMGQDERACWGEFIRRMEGRPPSKASAQGADTLQSSPQSQGVAIYHPLVAGGVSGLHPPVDAIPNQAMPRRVDDKEPAMASLQNPDEQGDNESCPSRVKRRLTASTDANGQFS